MSGTSPRAAAPPLALCLLALGCTSAPASPTPTADVPPVATDTNVVEDAGACPAPLGTPSARTTPPTYAMLDDTLRVNHLQAKATHNSYHQLPPRIIPDWNYAHAPLDMQLENQGVRGLELDLHWDARCGRLRVYHLPSLDDRSSCDLFTDCLTLVRRWSDAHPSHHPLFLHIEPKDAWTDAEAAARLDAMDREILSVFPRSLVITPDEVKGDAATVADGVRTRGWPTLRASRGRVLFYIDRTDNLRTVYTHGGRDLDARVAFVDSAMSDPFAGVLVLNNPRHADLAAAVRANFLVRVSIWGAGSRMDPSDVQAALDSGAQIISTDYPVPIANVTTGVTIPGGTPSRCNPVTAPMGCTSALVEQLSR